jgi:acetyl-CoA carboxylase biotin carboxyl carrier protein
LVWRAFASAHSVTLSLVNIDEIRELIALAQESGVAELEVQRGENRVRIRRAGFATQQEIVVAPAPAISVAAAPSIAAGLMPAADQSKPAKPAGPDPNLTLVKSPIVGTFYESASPGAAPFVRIGERVQPGKVLCIIESMKLMNEIEAETSGIVESKLVMNGQPVEYGEALFAIRAV